MGYNYGENIIVQIVDTGVDSDHEDMEANVDLSRSYDGATVGDPSGNHPHGTRVAGIMAARAFNGKGVRGIIPFAKIAGSNWLEIQRVAALEKAWLTGNGANEIAVSNNSWGSYFDTDTLYESIMELGTRTLRDGKGRIYVFAAGNDRGDKGNANLQYSLSNRYAIAVAGLKHDNTHADYSTPGSNILVSGYSGNYYQDSPTIGTTTIMGTSSNTGDINTKTTWTEDEDEHYTFVMNGTSAATPTVAASIALVLEACPDLTWRDVKYLTAKHAKQIDVSNSSWVTNAADTPLKHSIDYGFGLINTQGMIEDCTSTYVNLPAEKNYVLTKLFNVLIPDDQNTYSFDLNMTANMTIEWIEATIDCSSPYASDYRIELTSPQGTKTSLMTEDTDPEIKNWMRGGFRLSTAAMMGEKSNGIWRVDMTDQLSGDTGTLNTIELKVYGH
jgi:subtilisin-like proprotein convertase family protein